MYIYHTFSERLMYLVPSVEYLGQLFEVLFEHFFCHDLALDARSQGISGISLHIISLRIFLDGSGLRIEIH